MVQALRHAQDIAAQHAPRDGADAAEHCGHKGLEAQQVAHIGTDLGIGVAVEHRADRRQGGADGKGEGYDIVGVDAHQLGGPGVFRRGLHGLSDLGFVDQQLQSHHHDHRHADVQDGLGGQRQVAPVQGSEIDQGGGPKSDWTKTGS